MRCSCPSVQGHSTRKSTAFSPSSTTYDTQSLIHYHMMAHYRFVERAKSAVDCKPPKSMKGFVNSKYRKKRQRSSETHKRTRNSVDRGDGMRDGIEDNEIVYSNESGYVNAEMSRPRTAPEKRNNTERKSMDRSRYSQLKTDSTFVLSTPSISYQRQPKQVRRSSTPRYKIEMYSPEPLIVGEVCPTFSLDLTSLNLSDSVNMRKTYRQARPSTSLSQHEQEKLKVEERLVEEEQAYLKFVEEITTDVLHRGIYTDRVLRQVFDSHIERRKGFLNERRMRELVDELKLDLGIEDSEIYDAKIEFESDLSNPDNKVVAIDNDINNNSVIGVDSNELKNIPTNDQLDDISNQGDDYVATDDEFENEFSIQDDVSVASDNS